MEKYLGIVKVIENHFGRSSIKLLVKTYDDMNDMNKWFSLYPKCEHIVFNNSLELEHMFEDFRDYTPVSDLEIKEDRIVSKEYTKILKDNYYIDL